MHAFHILRDAYTLWVVGSFIWALGFTVTYWWRRHVTWVSDTKSFRVGFCTPHHAVMDIDRLNSLIQTLESLDLAYAPGGPAPWTELITNIKGLRNSQKNFQPAQSILDEKEIDPRFLKQIPFRTWQSASQDLNLAFGWSTASNGDSGLSWSRFYNLLIRMGRTVFFHDTQVQLNNPAIALAD